jgi:hypothetical protein
VAGIAFDSWSRDFSGIKTMILSKLVKIIYTKKMHFDIVESPDFVVRVSSLLSKNS